ncbi:MAG: mannonate dehydratase, partial [Chloroflexi bacterium]|nr:mannonate dehydratase [Chloroflexota bacterium]
MENSIRVAVGQLGELTDLQFAAQLGVKGVQMNNPRIPGEERWEYMDLLRLRMRAQDAGLKLEALENTPLSFYDKVMLGLPGRDEQ